MADDLGVSPETLRTWIRLADGRRSGPAVVRTGTAASPPAGSVEQENAALRRRVCGLEEERDILRKAARHFAGEPRGDGPTRLPVAAALEPTAERTQR